jgi:hypothetical protein
MMPAHLPRVSLWARGARVLAMLLAASTICARAGDTPAPTAVFKEGATTSGWIDLVHYTNLGIYLPVEINGHPAMAWLYEGPSKIDKSFAASIGLGMASGEGPVGGVDVRLGDLTVHDAVATPYDLQRYRVEDVAKIVGQPLVFMLGQEFFDRFAVDIDVANHRIAFLDPNAVTKPPGAIEVPLIELDGERVVPLSVDGAAPAQFEFGLGNMNGPLLLTPAYAEANKLLAGRPASQRLSGPFVETVVTVGHLAFAGVDFPATPIAVIPDSQLPPHSVTGEVGLPLLAKFRLIVDYPHNRLYAIPNAAAGSTPIPKDRIGLMLRLKGSSFDVAFVSPNSPAAAAGFKKGDAIAQIDGKPAGAWPLAEIIGFQMAGAGTTHLFTMVDGSVRRITAADFF